MQKYKTIVKIPIPIYETNLILSYNYTDEELIDIIKTSDHFPEHRREDWVKYIDDYKLPFAGLYMTNDFQHLIRISEAETQKELINTVTHELLHFLSGMLRHRGLYMTQETEEAFCYLQGYLMEEAYEKFIYEIIQNS